MNIFYFDPVYQERGWGVYKMFLFILYAISMYPWFIWSSTSPILIVIIGSFFSGVFYILNKRCFDFNKKKNIFSTFILLLSFLIDIKGFNIIGFIQQLFVIVNIVFLLNIKGDYKIKVFDFITKWMANLLLVSLLFYFLFLIGISLPFTVIGNSNLGYTGNNYYVFLTNIDTEFLLRFRSIFAEPGHLTMGVIPLLYANRFNLKNKYVIILLLAEIFTFSLAGYLTIFVSLMIFSFSSHVKNFYPRIVIFFLLISSVLIYQRMGQDNVVYTAIFSRLFFDEDKGTIAGSNRTDELTDEYFGRYICSTESIFGLGYKETNYVTSEGGAGFKVFILRFGVLSFLIILLFYFSFVINYFEFDVFGYFIIILLLLIQNTYPFWFCIAFTYITGVSKLKDRRMLKQIE